MVMATIMEKIAYICGSVGLEAAAGTVSIK